MTERRRITALTTAALLLATAVARADDGPTVAFLGIAARPADAVAQAASGLPEGVGLTVTFVEPAGPAGVDRAVRPGDVLHKLDDQLLVNVAQMATLVQLHKPGDAVTLTVVRDGQPVRATLKLGGRRRPAAPPPAVANANDPRYDDEKVPTLPGVVGPGPMTNRVPDDPQLPLPGSPRTSVSYSDGTYSARVTTDPAGHKWMTVADHDGKQVAAGPVDTPEQWNAFPADVRQHLQTVQNLLGGNRRSTGHTNGSR